MRIFYFNKFFQSFGLRIHPPTIDSHFSKGFKIMGGAKRITNLIADLFEIRIQILPTYLHRENSFIYWHLDCGARTRLLCSAYSDFTVVSFPIGLSPRTMQDLSFV